MTKNSHMIVLLVHGWEGVMGSLAWGKRRVEVRVCLIPGSQKKVIKLKSK